MFADTHIGADPAATFQDRYCPARSAAAVIAPALGFAPEIVVCLGDLARTSGERGDYLQWQRLFAPLTADRPTILMPGNHDRRERMVAQFASHPMPRTERIVSVVETPTLRLIALDSLYRHDVVPGLLGEAQRWWLESFLDESDKRSTLILVHHHLGDDDKSLLDGDRLLNIVQPRPQVKALLTAHQHVYRHQIVDGLHRLAAPALGMPFAPEERLGWLEAHCDGEGAALRFRALDGAADPELRLQWRQ